VLSGSAIEYSYTVTNNGPDDARGLVLDNILSVGQALNSVMCTATGGATCPGTAGLPMTAQLLPVGASLTLTTSVQVSNEAISSVRSSLRATVPGDVAFSNNIATVETQTRIPTSSGAPSFIRLQSDAWESIGSAGTPVGHNFSYSRANALLDVSADHGVLHVNVSGSQHWISVFYMPDNLDRVTKGTYVDSSGITNTNTHDPNTGGMIWFGEGRACDHIDTFTVDDVVYVAGELASVDIRFEQHCHSEAPALRGQIHWIAADASLPPGPVNPPPAGLWQPASGATPANGNFVYIQSDAHDFIGEGRTETYTQTNAVLSVQENAGELVVTMHGNRLYEAHFKAMAPLTRMAAGYYPDVEILPFGNPAFGRMSFYGDARACDIITGWFVIDSISFTTGGALTGVDARFEQHCEGRAPALRGQIHWRSDDPAQPDGPADPPVGLWSPPGNAIPAAGNFFYAESDPADWVGQGLTKLYTPLDSVITVGGSGPSSGNLFQISIEGDERWSGSFQAMDTLPDLKPGYYANLMAYPFHNHAFGGQSWMAEGHNCGESHGWVVIDSVTYSGNSLQSITMRFEEQCDLSDVPHHGMVRWSADDTRQPTPPQNPPPMDLWNPPAGSTPASGNYFYVESEANEFIGMGKTYLYTPLNAVFETNVTGSVLVMLVTGDEPWHTRLRPMSPYVQLQPGFYNLPNGPSIAKGEMEWDGNNRGCQERLGWFVVDSVTYGASGSLEALDVRFEQRCGPIAPKLRGKLHWRSDDPTQPPGPQAPPPGLWAPPANVVPASGNFLYLESDPGDFIGKGNSYLLDATDSTFTRFMFVEDMQIGVSRPPSDSFVLSFDHMKSIPRMEPGYYPNAQKAVTGNPTLGGLDITGNGSSCSLVNGWFVVNSVTYTGETLTAFDVTFQQFCNGNATVSSRGRVRCSQ
jgi:uncharacterized repeat protein (TIGR01451 family)